MHLALVAATPFEIAQTIQYLETKFESRENGLFVLGNLSIQTLITGVGIANTAFQLGLFFAQNRPDLCLQAGIAGTYNTARNIGDVLQVHTEQYGDLGVEEADGRFTDIFELGLIDGNKWPFSENGMLHNRESGNFDFLPRAAGVTVNKVHGEDSSILRLREKYPNVDIESMEGAAFFQACLTANLPFLSIRAISNYVEARNRENWNIGLAIERLNRVVEEVIVSLQQLAI